MQAYDSNDEKSTGSPDNGGPDHAARPDAAQVFEAPRRRRPRQARARETVEAIVQAAAEIIAAEGFARASTNRIAIRAGVSIGSLYQYFPNKEAIREEIVARHRNSVRQIIQRAMLRFEDGAVPFTSALTGLFEDLVAMHREDPALIRALGESQPDARFETAGRETETRRYVRRLADLLRERARPPHEDPVAAAWVIVWTTETLARSLGHQAPGDASLPRLIAEAVSLVAGYARVVP